MSDSKDVLIRSVPIGVHAALAESAARNHRSMEKHALHLLVSGLQSEKADTCGELAERIWTEQTPPVELEEIENYLSDRGRTSNRP